MNIQERTDGEKLLSALDRVTWYNGLGDDVLSWKTLPVSMDMRGHTQMEKPDYIQARSYRGSQLEVIWMIAVCMFGEYGTSPRTGWITDIYGFYDFIDRITATHQAYLKMCGNEGGLNCLK